MSIENTRDYVMRDYLLGLDKDVLILNSLNIPYRAERAVDINNISLAKLGIKSEVDK